MRDIGAGRLATCPNCGHHLDRPFRIEEVGNTRIDREERTIEGRSGKTNLSGKQFGIFACLLDDFGRTVTRETILEIVWPNIEIGRVIEVHLFHVRNALKAVGSDLVIESVRERGYRLALKENAVLKRP